MAYWLMKSEPETWSWQQQLARGKQGEVWNGVRNHQAAGFLRGMQKGDLALFYHSGKKREVVGIVAVSKAAYPDPTDATGKFVAVTVVARDALARPVSLAEMKAEPKLQKLLLFRQSRLSVMPVGEAEWHHILKLAKIPA